MSINAHILSTKHDAQLYWTEYYYQDRLNETVHISNYNYQDRLNETIHAKIQRLERPSMSSIYQPSQSLYSRLSNRFHQHLTKMCKNGCAISFTHIKPYHKQFQKQVGWWNWLSIQSPLKILSRFRESLVNDFGDQDNVFEDEVEKERVEDKEDNTDVEDFSLVDNSDLLARPPKIWISKTASMEHDLDWSSIL